jgi:hypothetical protein
LWQHFTGPPAQNSVAIYNDGSVVEKSTFDTSELRPEKGVRTFILGGADFRCLDTSQDYADLLAAGYTFTALPDANTYEGTYRDSYTYEWTPETQAHQAALHDKQVAAEAAARESARLARIATLEAELAALRGL